MTVYAHDRLPTAERQMNGTAALTDARAHLDRAHAHLARMLAANRGLGLSPAAKRAGIAWSASAD